MPVAIFFLTVDCHGAMTLSQKYGGFFVGGGVGWGGQARLEVVILQPNSFP